MDILSRVKEIEDEIIDIRKRIHQNPELSFQEYETSDLVENELKKLDIEVKREGLKTGVIGILKGKYPGKTIALRADMDALPIKEETVLDFSSQNEGVMHACGHDIHTSILIGCAKVLSKFKNEIKGNIKFIFQPAEEKLLGSKTMIEAGVLENPKVDAIIGIHCWPELPVGTIGVKKGALMASSNEIIIKVKGQGGHAAHPHKSIDPIIMSSFILSKLQTIVSRESSPVDPIVITMGTIHGGTASNIIPSDVTLSGTVRTVSNEMHERVPEMIERIVKYTAKSMRGDAEITYREGSLPLICDNKLVDMISGVTRDLLGKDKLIELKNPSMGSEDFSFYLKKVPGIFIRLGTVNEMKESKLPLHSPKIIFDDGAIAVGITVMSESALRYLSQPFE